MHLLTEDLEHDDLEKACSEIALRLTRIGRPARRCDVMDVVDEMVRERAQGHSVTERSAAIVVLARELAEAEAASHAEYVALTGGKAAPPVGTFAPVSGEISTADLVPAPDGGAALSQDYAADVIARAGLEVDRLLALHNGLELSSGSAEVDRYGLMLAQPGQRVTHDFSDEDDPTDSDQPGQGGDDWRAELDRLASQHPGYFTEAPQSGSSSQAPKSPGHRALESRRSHRRY